MQHSKTYNEQGDKWCSNCEVYHTIDSFGKNKISKDGRNWVCTDSRKKTLGKQKELHPEAARIILTDNMPGLNMIKRWKYTRPDAFEIYVTEIRKNQITQQPYEPTINDLPRNEANL